MRGYRYHLEHGLDRAGTCTGPSEPAPATVAYCASRVEDAAQSRTASIQGVGGTCGLAAATSWLVATGGVEP